MKYSGNNMICLGIESTAHTFGVGIVNNKGDIFADEKKLYVPPIGEGMTPRKVGEHHNKIFKEVMSQFILKLSKFPAIF